MKTKIALVCLALFSVFALASCGGKEYPNGEVNVYNWGEYIDEDLVDKFEETSGIKVNYDMFDSNESMYVKLQSGGVNYDVAIPSDYMIEKMKNEGMLEEIDYNNIPNYQYVGDNLKNQSYDTENKYTVPYFWGTVGILYNTTMVDDNVDSWDILWNEKYKGQIFMYDSQRDSLAVALKRLGYSLNSTNEQELLEAQQLLFDQKPLVQAYVGDPIRDKMIAEEGALAVVYSGDAMYCMQENPNLAYVIPKEGSNTWIDAMVIPKGAKNKANAEKFINFMTAPNVSLQNSQSMGFATTNKSALEQVPAALKTETAYWPSDEEIKNNEVFISLDQESAELYDKIWTEVLAYN